MNSAKKGLLLLLCLVLTGGCASSDRSQTGIRNGSGEGEPESAEEAEQDLDDYDVKSIEMEQSEKDEIEKQLFSVMEKCTDIGSRAAGERDSGAGLDEETVHQMAEAAAADGMAVTCGNYDYNMLNYEDIDRALRDASAGKEAEARFCVITSEAYFRYFHLQFADKELTVSYAAAVFDENGAGRIREMEKFSVYGWEYTEKGWLIWEKALSRNQEMDMHTFVRILPLDEKCRELGNAYILPVSYFCNNLFLTDWDADSMEKVEFNDLFDFLYEMKYGKKPDEENYPNGIPKEEFENVVRTYFDIPAEQLEAYARYDSEQGVYPWEAIGPWNRVQQFQPFPEVVKCEENGDGIWTLYVEAVFVEEGTDCSFQHEVTMKEMDGRWIYLGNKVDRDGSYSIPGYKARREFIE